VTHCHQNLYLKDVSGGVNEFNAMGNKYELQQLGHLAGSTAVLGE
jgi:hypothetical protein